VPAPLRIATVVGARPQFIKAAAVSRVFRGEARIRETLIHTGQHYDDNLSVFFFDELDLAPPDHYLGVGSGTHGAQTGRMTERIERVLLEAEPDLVLVYGDTNSTLAGALAAAKLPPAVAHVEAGLRSFNRRMPEEVNRVLTDHAANVLFAPTQAAVRNLRDEGIASERIHRVGDVMQDAALHFAEKAERASDVLHEHNLHPDGYVLATVHRAENTNDADRLRAVFEGLARVADDTAPVVLPLHPRTRQVARRAGLLDAAQRRLRLIEPVGYLDMMQLERAARLIATDSGGVQKEAFLHRVPCVTLRSETEWTELVELGWNRVVPPERAESVAEAIRQRLGTRGDPDAQPYGDGEAAHRIRDRLLNLHRRDS
jgi:UDP-GlcNAc3NAcA epimerase